MRRWVEELVEELSRRGVRVERVLLFGSRARGDYWAGSDVDLVVVSDDWEGWGVTERLGLLYRLWRGEFDANFVALTRGELEQRLRDSVVLRDASRYWVIVYEKV